MADGKVKVHWVTQDQGKNAVANALGYNAHNSAMKKYCAEYFDYDDNAPIAITITPADQFVPVPGKFNILFTMWEAIDVPKSYLPGLRAADMIVVPSTFCQQIFKPLTDKPIKVCFEGVEPEVFIFKERMVPDISKGEKFRFLWLGAPNPRKGYYSIMEFTKIIEKLPNFELYIKTTSHKKLTFPNLIKSILKRFGKIAKGQFAEWQSIVGSIKRFIQPEVADRVIRMGQHNNIIFDSRKVPLNELVALYHSAHCFLIPHCGEGWCLPLCEAMATGCPSVASNSTSVTDFFDSEVGFPVKCDIKESELQNYKMKARMYIPDTKDFVEQIFYVVRNYKEALRRGKKASYKIKTNFTWKKAARRFADIVEEGAKKAGLT